MSTMKWAGVMPAVTTPFNPDDTVDHKFLAEHIGWLLEHDVTGIVPLGSLGEGATLDFEEKVEVLRTCVRACDGKVPVMPGISALSTRGAVQLAQAAEEVGCSALMVLPPYVHKGPFAEMRAHFEAVFTATDLPCMLYNNPIAYGVDVSPEEIVALAGEYPNLQAVKESSGDVRRMSAVRELAGDRIALFAGLDDMALEAARMGADGWIAGLVNAFPGESVALFELGKSVRLDKAMALYTWFLPLLRLDTVPEFVQLIKLCQAEVGRGSERVRPPRQPITGEDRETALAIIREALAHTPGA